MSFYISGLSTTRVRSVLSFLLHLLSEIEVVASISSNHVQSDTASTLDSFYVFFSFLFSDGDPNSDPLFPLVMLLNHFVTCVSYL